MAKSIDDGVEGGYVKIYRTIQKKGWYKKSEAVHLWVHLIIQATHSEREYLWNGQTILLKPGQFVTGRKKLSTETGISEGKIRKLLELFKSSQQINQQISNTSSLISVLNYEKYHTNDQQINQQATNKQPTSNQQATTKQELKELEEGKEEERKPPRKKEKWNTNPSEEEIEFLVLSELETNQTIEYFDRLRKIQLTAIQVNDFWIAFKIQQFSGGKLYEDRARCLQHFRNWIKNREVPTISIHSNGRKQNKGDERTKEILAQTDRG